MTGEDAGKSRFYSIPDNWPVLVFAGVVFFVFGLIFTHYFFYERTTLGNSDRNRIAVLPLKPLSPDLRDPIWEFAIAESLILKLGSSKSLSVRPISAVRKYVDLKGADDVFSAQDAVANDIGNILLTRFGNTPGDLKAKRGSTSEEAYRLYLQGIYLVEKEIWPI